jgi:hypothetical protein
LNRITGAICSRARFAVFGGRHAPDLLENPNKGVVGTVSDLIGDFRDTHVGRLQQRAGMPYPQFVQMFHEILTGMFFEQQAEVGRIDVKML